MAAPAILTIESGLYLNEREAENEAARLNALLGPEDPVSLAYRFLVLGISRGGVVCLWAVVDRPTWAALNKH